MRLLRLSLLVAIASCLCVAQTATDLESKPVKRVASRMACTCGCKTNMACDMPPWPCSMCQRNKAKIFKMQQAGMSDNQIVAQFVKDEGPDIVLNQPGTFDFLMPYIALALGLLVVWWFIRRMRRPVLAAPTPADAAALDRYRDQIEKEVSKLD